MQVWASNYCFIQITLVTQWSGRSSLSICKCDDNMKVAWLHLRALRSAERTCALFHILINWSIFHLPFIASFGRSEVYAINYGIKLNVVYCRNTRTGISVLTLKCTNKFCVTNCECQYKGNTISSLLFGIVNSTIN